MKNGQLSNRQLHLLNHEDIGADVNIHSGRESYLCIFSYFLLNKLAKSEVIFIKKFFVSQITALLNICSFFGQTSRQGNIGRYLQAAKNCIVNLKLQIQLHQDGNQVTAIALLNRKANLVNYVGKPLHKQRRISVNFP